MATKKSKDYFYGLLQKVYQLQHVSKMYVFVGYTGFTNNRCKQAMKLHEQQNVG